MKITGVILKPTIDNLKVVCDNCREDCTNWHFNVVIKDNHDELVGLIETVCFDCYEKGYRRRIYEQEKRQSEFTLANISTIKKSISNPSENEMIRRFKESGLSATAFLRSLGPFKDVDIEEEKK